MAKAYRLDEIAEERREALDVLIPRLLNELGSDREVGRELGVHENTIKRWRRLNSMIRKPRSEFVREAIPDAS